VVVPVDELDPVPVVLSPDVLPVLPSGAGPGRPRLPLSPVLPELPGSTVTPGAPPAPGVVVEPDEPAVDAAGSVPGVFTVPDEPDTPVCGRPDGLLPDASSRPQAARPRVAARAIKASERFIRVPGG
jgi:hypothetical protein